MLKKKANATLDENTHLVVCISPKQIVCTVWALESPHARLRKIQQTLTEIPLYVADHIININLLHDIVKNSIKEAANTPTQTHFLLELTYNNEQFVSSNPHQGKSQSQPNISSQATHLYTHENGANMWFHTTIHASLLVQLHLLAMKMKLNLNIISSFSLCCLNLYFQTINTQQRQRQLHDDLKKAKFHFCHLPTRDTIKHIAHISDEVINQQKGIEAELYAAIGAINMTKINQMS